jgi:glucosamine-6-phosphate deaminase
MSDDRHATDSRGSTATAPIPQAIATRQYDALRAHIFEDGDALAARAVEDLAPILDASIAERGYASIVLATGNSQLRFMEHLRQRQGIAWSHVMVFHMDEYLGMPQEHPASFRRFIREQLVDVVCPRAFFGVRGDAPDVEAELQRYGELIERYPPAATVLGIGENGHLAFNDPPADFTTNRMIHIVELDEACRWQQVGEGHFATLEDVPRQALSLTIPALLTSRHVLAIVPERRKAVAVKTALEGPIAPECPASILRRQAHAQLYLDRESATLLDG